MTAVAPLSQEEAVRIAWKRGLLGYKLHAGQNLINDALSSAKSKLFVCNCARQFGKSFLMVTKAVEQAIKKPQSRIKYGTAFQTDLLEFILPTFERVLEDCPPTERPRYKAQGQKYIFPNGSEIKLVGLDMNPNGLRGNTIDLIIIDECGFVDKLDYLYKSIIIPATMHRPEAKIIMISTPPSTPAHDFVDYAQKAATEGSYIKLTIHDNPMIGPDVITELVRESGGDTSTTWRREYLCEFLTDEDSNVIPEWKDEYILDTKPDQYNRFYHRYVFMDLGVKDFTVVLFGYYDFRRATLVVEDEVKLSGPKLTTLLLKDTVEAFEKRLWPEHAVYRRISDNNNPQLLQDLAILHKMSFISTGKDTLEAMVNELRLMVQKGQIEVHPRCVQLAGCLKYGVWDSKKKKFARSATFGHFDALAAIIYGVRNLDKHCNPIPTTFGFDPRNARIKTQKYNSEGSRLMNQIFQKPTRKPTY